MKELRFITTLGLLLAEALGALFLATVSGRWAIGIFTALIFLVCASSYLSRHAKNRVHEAMPAAIGFAIGFLAIVYYSFHTGSLWLVILLCLNAAGFILALEHLTMKRPLSVPVKIEVYEEKPKKKTTKKATSKKTAKKTTAKKKRGRPKKNA